ncbi:GntR family transcriptional regulator [Brevibacterium litoralis]|uniref:GntR family transcriptional regulator n=1 Tax=Brevibacterium litoralis TaxID=3138935 RepID=UPI0032F0518E
MSRHDRETIREELTGEILTGVIAPGTPLREVLLAERFGVSRTPVREALTVLEQSGFAVRKGRSLFVPEVDSSTAQQVFEVWELLEIELVAHAARGRRLEDLIRAEDLVHRDRADAPAEVAVTDRVLRDIAFHRALWHAAHHTVLEELLERAVAHPVHHPRSSPLVDDDRWQETVEEHSRILAAIAAQDVDSAREFTREHFRAAHDARVERLRSA